MQPLSMGVDVSDLRRLQEAFKAAPEMVQRELRGFVIEVTADLTADVVERTPTSKGTLRSSIIGNVTEIDGLGVQGVVGSNREYAVAVELGTRPHMPPVAPLIDWVQQRFGLSGKEAERAAWRVARGIARRGTPAVGMFHFAWRDNRDQVAAKFAETVRRITTQIGGAA